MTQREKALQFDSMVERAQRWIEFWTTKQAEAAGKSREVLDVDYMASQQYSLVVHELTSLLHSAGQNSGECGCLRCAVDKKA